MKKETPALGLYLHIPFCQQKCAYCDFYSLPGREAQMDDYVAALERHLTEIAPRAQAHRVDTVFFGGGTPSYLGEKRLTRLLKLIKKLYPVSADAEITLEANPDSAGDWKALRALRRAGFNRLSLGMQTSDDALLKGIGRIHTFEQVKAAVAAARRAKIGNLSLDLIYGLPGQHMTQWQQTLSDAVALEPEHLSCYALTLEEGTPLYARRQEEDLAGNDEQADLYLYAVEFLRGHGYAQYEISNFAKQGKESRHNLKYWTLGEYAGFGPGAHSDFGGVRFAYEKDLDLYLQGDLRLSESTDIPPLSRDVEYLMLGLRTVRGIDAQVFERRYRQRFAPLETLLKSYREKGWCAQDGTRWYLTPEGFLVSNQLIGNLLDTLEQEKLRRMKAAERGDFRMV